MIDIFKKRTWGHQKSSLILKNGKTIEDEVPSCQTTY